MPEIIEKKPKTNRALKTKPRFKNQTALAIGNARAPPARAPPARAARFASARASSAAAPLALAPLNGAAPKAGTRLGKKGLGLVQPGASIRQRRGRDDSFACIFRVDVRRLHQ